MSGALLRPLMAAALLAAEPWAVARPDFRWSFPRDHYAHPAYKTEWWYFTGQLEADGDPARRFGYQFTFFRIGVLRDAPPTGSDWATQMLIMGHAAVTDLATGRHIFSEVLYRTVPMLGGFGSPGDSLVAWSRAPAGTDGRWTLRWDAAAGGFAFAMRDDRQGLAFELATRPERPLVFQGPNGFSRKGAGESAASLYYSYTRLTTTGTVELDGRPTRVRGRSWMDKEFGSNQLARDQVGWDWFSLQLDDGRDLMLYLLRDSTGATSWASGTVVTRTGAPRWLDSAAFTVNATERWTSDSTGARYPARWTIEVPAEGLRLDIVPLLAGQENRSRLVRGLYYWEGAVRVLGPSGGESGRGYVELVGYGRGLRPAI